jgi:hypothetical protein
MTTRSVYHTIRRPDGTPWPGVSIVFRLVNGGFTGASTYPAEALYLAAGADGELTATLWINVESAVAARWRCALPDGEIFDFDLPAGDGSPVALSALRAAAPYVPATSLASLLDGHTAALNPHPQYAAGSGAEVAAHAALTTTAHGGLVAEGDPRLSDARPPTPHTASHATGQPDALAPADIGAATAAHSHANDAWLTRVQAVQALSDGASIAWDMSLGHTATLTIGGARTLANPTNLINGASYVLRVTQDGAGGRTLAYGSVFKWPGGTAPTLSTAAGAKDVITFLSDGAGLYGSILKGFA